MPTRLIENLKEKVDVSLRTSKSLGLIDGKVYLQEKVEEEVKHEGGAKSKPTLKTERFLVFEITPPEEPEEEGTDGKKKEKDKKEAEKMIIKMIDITDVKVKEFNEKIHVYHVLSLCCSNEKQPSHLFFMFEKPEDRDRWSDGLRSLVHAQHWAHKPAETEADSAKLHLIKDVTLLAPQPGEAIRLKVETANKAFAKTHMTQAVTAGITVLPVAKLSGNEGFQVGQAVIVNPGSNGEEMHEVAGFGNIMLKAPLKSGHGARAAVTNKDSSTKTFLAEDVKVGAQVLPVQLLHALGGKDGWTRDQEVIIDAGTPSAEKNLITGFTSIVLRSALKNNHVSTSPGVGANVYATSQVEFPIPEAKTDSASCKELVSDFVMQNFIVPAESASLYRLVRSLLSRVNIEKQADGLIKEIDLLRYPRLIEGCTTPTEVRNLISDADKKLHHLREEVQKRIGAHGPAAEMICMILERNIEKTRHHNRMAFATRYGADGGLEVE